MQMIKHYAGLLLIVLGALALIMTRLGIGLHIRSIKRDSRY